VRALEDRCLLSAGTLDSTFGSGGVVTNSFGPTTNWNGAAAVAIYPNAGTANDGKIVAAGLAPASSHGGNYIDGFAVARYEPNGTLDSSFGSGGEVTTKLSSSLSRAYDVAIQSNGKIVAAGFAENSPGNSESAVVRYNLNGSLDTTFGSGKNAGSVLGTSGVAEALAVQADGKIVVVEASSGQFALVRYNTNGSLDTTFNGSGTVLTNFTGSVFGGNDAMDVGIYPPSSTANAGKIVVVGTLRNADGTHSVVILRYNPDGSPDLPFGGGSGYVLLSTSDSNAMPHVAIQADDRLDVAFTTYGAATWEMSVARLQAGGAPDPGFGVGGIVTTNHQMWDQATSVALQANGQIVVAGTEEGPTGTTTFVVARFNAADGSLDTTFGVNGFQTAPVLAYHGFGVDVAIQPDGRIVLAGTQESAAGTDYAFALARLLPSDPGIGSFTASSDSVNPGSNLTLTAQNITDTNPGAAVTGVTFYYYDGTGTKQVVGNVMQTSPGVWTSTFTVGLAPGSYTLYAQAEDSYGVFGDPLALALTVQ
jgi:uncharacterized delta-60 repeat protein